jgi:sulfite reductase alpha subunit-like flavoprotein
MLSTHFKKSTFSLIGTTKTNAAFFSGLRPSMNMFFTKRSLASLKNAVITSSTSLDTTATATTITANTSTTIIAETGAKTNRSTSPENAPSGTTTELKKGHVGALLYVFPEYRALAKRMRRGFWSLSERERFHDFFINQIRKEPSKITQKDMQKISDYVGSRSVSQCYYHLRYYYKVGY